MNVRAVVFDLGKVLVDFDYGIAARRIAERAALPAAEIQKLIDQSPLLLRYESAQITSAEFFDAVRAGTNYRGSFEEFAQAFADIFTEIAEMTRLQGQLMNQGLPTFVLSNTNEIAIAHVRRRFPFFDGFTGHVFSFEERAMKPNERIYRAVEERSGCSGAEVLFIDDKAENCVGGERLGWRTICHSHPAETMAHVRALVPW